MYFIISTWFLLVFRIGDNLGTVAPESPMPTTQSRLSPSAFSRSQSALDAVGVSDGKSNSFRCVDVSPAQSNQSPTSTMIECGNSKGDPNESTYQQQGGISNRIRPASSLGVSGTLGDYNFSGIPNKFQSYFGEGLDDSSSVERFGDSDKRTSGPKLTKKLSSNSAHSDLLNEVSFGLDYLNSQAQAAHTTQQKTQAIYAKTNGDSSAPPNSFTAVSDNSSDRVANETQSGEGFMQEECGNDFFGDFGYLQFPNNKGDFDLNQMERNDHYMNMMTVANRDKLHELCSFVFGDEGLAGTSAGPITEVPYGQQTPAESRATPTASRTVATSQQQQQFSYSDRQDNLNQPGPQDVILKELLTQDDVCTTVEPPPPKKKSTKRTAGRAATVDSDAITSPQFQCLPDSNVLGITQAISSSAPPPKKRRATQKNKILEVTV